MCVLLQIVSYLGDPPSEGRKELLPGVGWVEKKDGEGGLKEKRSSYLPTSLFSSSLSLFLCQTFFYRPDETQKGSQDVFFLKNASLSMVFSSKKLLTRKKIMSIQTVTQGRYFVVQSSSLSKTKSSPLSLVCVCVYDLLLLRLLLSPSSISNFSLPGKTFTLNLSCSKPTVRAFQTNPPPLLASPPPSPSIHPIPNPLFLSSHTSPSQQLCPPVSSLRQLL